MIRSFIAFMAVVFVLTACRKQKTTWDSNWSAPLVHGHLTINDLIPEEYTETNSDGYLSLVYHKTAYSFTIDTLINLPDTTVSSYLTLGLGTVTVSPGFTFTDNDESEYHLDEIQLKRIIAGKGTANISVESPWSGKSKLTIAFPKIKEMGAVFSRVMYMDSGSVANPAVQSAVVDMTDFDFDLRGIDGLFYNLVPTQFTVESNEPSKTFEVAPSDSIRFFIQFSDLVPKYALGYFGSYVLHDTVGFSLEPMKKIIGGSVDVDSIDINITIRNGFNIIAQSKITKVTGINTRTSTASDLSFPQLNSSININPASGGLYDMVPSEYPVPINNQNSNIAEFVENLSDSMELGFELKINPDGNTTAGSDELFPTSSLDLYWRQSADHCRYF